MVKFCVDFVAEELDTIYVEINKACNLDHCYFEVKIEREIQIITGRLPACCYYLG